MSNPIYILSDKDYDSKITREKMNLNGYIPIIPKRKTKNMKISLIKIYKKKTNHC